MTYSFPQEANKSAMVFLKTSTAEMMADRIRSNDPLVQSAKILRDSIMEIDFGLQDKFCDKHDLEKSWENIVIPPPVLTFFAVLFNFDANHFKANIENDDAESDDDDNIPATDKVSAGKQRKMISLLQIMYYILHNGRKRTPLHLMNGQAIHDTCKSSTLIKSFNHFGMCVSYDEILRYHNDMVWLTVESGHDNVPLPSHFSTEDNTSGTLDNFDHEEATLSGIGGSHDTVLVLFQDKTIESPAKPLISESYIVHGPKVFNCELPCQELKEYIKPVRKPDLPEDYEVEPELYTLGQLQHDEISQKDIIWSLARMNLPTSESQMVTHTNDKQTMPSWSGFNSIVTSENVPQKKVGFLPLIPQPVTQYATVYTALKNFQNVLSQLKQAHIAITCDEGVYHIAREITLCHKDEFQDIVLCLGSFHMIKVLLGCLGKFIESSGAESIFVENSLFGINVVQSVLSGSNYVRSVKGMMLLCEVMERLRWCTFFKEYHAAKYEEELHLLRDLKAAVGDWKRTKSQEIMIQISTKMDNMLVDFKTYRDAHRDTSETFTFWDDFIQLVSLLKDLIRADREGDWQLHLNTVQSILSLFALYDRTNYLRWASLYLEDMRKLPETAPDVYEGFQAGKLL